MTYIMGFSVPIIEYLSIDYDIVMISGEVGENQDLYKYGEVWGLSQLYINKLKEQRFLRVDESKSEDPTWEHNRRVLLDEFEKSFGVEYFKKVKKILIFDPIDFILPLTSYVGMKDHPLLNLRKNEFHDTVFQDEDELKKIADGNYKVCSKIDSKCSIIAFGTHFKNISINLVKYAVNKATAFEMAYAFINDPAFYTPIFEYEKIPFRAYYFRDDKRGSRDFCEFPIGQLQHIVWDKRNKKTDLLSLVEAPQLKKDRSVFFAGTIFQEKGGRVDLWNRYLRDLRVPGAGIFVPLRPNGILHSKENNNRFLNKVKDVFSDLHEEMIAHPHYEGHLVPDEYEEKVSKFKYGVLFRCVSYNDSLNFRPILYARLRILPLLDPQYDPAALQIPPYIQSKLLVHSHEDIAEKVKYFDEHFEEREKLLDELEDIFSIKTFEKTWKKDLKKYL